MLTEGSIQPAWSALDQAGRMHSSADKREKWLVLYFYPEDDTPGCTVEACGIRDNFGPLTAKAEVFGVSKDSAESHNAFIGKYSLPFSLLADTESKLIQAFGTDGKTLPKRTTFLIDASGVIRKIYKGFDPAHHADLLLKDLESL